MIGSKGFTLGIVGVGRNELSIGRRIATEMLDAPDLGTILLYGRNEESLDVTIRSLEHESSLKTDRRKPSISKAGLDVIAQFSDLVAICVEAVPNTRELFAKRLIERADLFATNFELIGDLGRCFQGSLAKYVIFTNPVAPLTYQFLSTSGLPHDQVYGFQHVDSYRFEKIINSFNPEWGALIEAPVIGPHDNRMIACYSNIRMGRNINNPDSEGLPNTILQTDQKEKHSLIQAKVRYLGFSLMGLQGTTADDAAHAFFDCYPALVYGGSNVKVATMARLVDPKELIFQNEDNRMRAASLDILFTGWPISGWFRANERGIPLLSLSDPEEEEFIKVLEEEHQLLTRLRQGSYETRRIDRIDGENISFSKVRLGFSRELSDYQVNPSTTSPPVLEKIVSPQIAVSSPPPIRIIETSSPQFVPRVSPDLHSPFFLNRAVFYVALGRDLVVYEKPGNSADIIETVRINQGHTYRSVLSDKDILYLGHRSGIDRISLDDPSKIDFFEIKNVPDWRLPSRFPKFWGVNSIASSSGHLYGTHSIAGVLSWDLRKHHCSALFDERTYEIVEGAKESLITRGIQLSPEGGLSFSSGPSVYWFRGKELREYNLNSARELSGPGVVEIHSHLWLGSDLYVLATQGNTSSQLEESVLCYFGRNGLLKKVTISPGSASYQALASFSLSGLPIIAAGSPNLGIALYDPDLIQKDILPGIVGANSLGISNPVFLQPLNDFIIYANSTNLRLHPYSDLHNPIDHTIRIIDSAHVKVISSVGK